MPLSNADRQRLFRERKRLEAEQQAARELAEAAEVERLLRPAPGVPTEEEYVERELAVTKVMIEVGAIKTRDAQGHDLGPLRRSEEYLRWRYRGFRASEVASL